MDKEPKQKLTVSLEPTKGETVSHASMSLAGVAAGYSMFPGGKRLWALGWHWILRCFTGHVFTKRKALAISTNTLCAFKILSYLPFCICDQIYRRRMRGRGRKEGEGEREEKDKQEGRRKRRREGGGGRGGGYVCYLFLHYSLFLFCNLTSIPSLRGNCSLRELL